MSFLDGLFQNTTEGGDPLEISDTVLTGSATITPGLMYLLHGADATCVLTIASAPIVDIAGKRIAVKVTSPAPTTPGGDLIVVVPAGMFIEADNGAIGASATIAGKQEAGNYREWKCDSDGVWRLLVADAGGAAGGGGLAIATGVITADQTVSPGRIYLVNSGLANVVITIGAALANDLIGVKLVGGAGDLNAVTVAAGGALSIEGVDDSHTPRGSTDLWYEGTCAIFELDSAGTIWRLIHYTRGTGSGDGPFPRDLASAIGTNEGYTYVGGIADVGSLLVGNNTGGAGWLARGVEGQTLAVTDTFDLAWVDPEPPRPASHAPTHADGGADELNVTGLSGKLADPQTPLAHKASHQLGGADALNVGGLSGLLADPQTAGGIKTATTTVAVATAAAPSAGQVLVASSGTAAAWATPLQLTSTAPSQVSAVTASPGSATDPAHRDHIHSVATAAPVALAVGGTNVTGVVATLALSDHKHALPAFGSTAGTFAEGNDPRLNTPVAHATRHADGGADELLVTGLSGLLADPQTAGGIKTATTTVAVATAAAPSAGQVLVASSGTAAAWATPLQLTSTAPSQVSAVTASPGSATDPAHRDHIHSVATAAPVALAVGGTNVTGVVATLALSDHKHALPAFGSTAGTFAEGNDPRLNTPVAHATRHADGGADELLVTGLSGLLADPQTAGGIKTATTTVAVATAAAPSAGQVLVASSGTAAAWATPLQLTSTAPSQVSAVTASPGSATDPAHRDHIHSVATAAPVALAVGGTNVTGVVATLALSDHKHALPAFGSTAGTFAEGNDPRLNTPVAHATRHADGGADELNVQNLSGRLADPQTADSLKTLTTAVSTAAAAAPSAGQVLTATTSDMAVWAAPAAPAAHKASHQLGGADVLNVGGLSGLLADPQTAGGIKTATTTVAVAASAAPTAGQVLIASSGTAAAWGTQLTNTAPSQVSAVTASPGSATDPAHRDHIHSVATAAPVALAVGGTNVTGVVATLALSDHKHALPAFGSTAGTFAEGNDPRLDPPTSAISNSVTAVAGTVYLVDTASTTVTVTLPPAAANAKKEVTIKRKAGGNNTVQIVGNASETIDGRTAVALDNDLQWVTVICDGTAWFTFGDSLVAGKLRVASDSVLKDIGGIATNTIMRRNAADLIVGGPVTMDGSGNLGNVGTINGAGLITLSSGSPADVRPGIAAGPGDGTSASRDNHQHALLTAAPVALVVGGPNVSGANSAVAGSNHIHALPAFGSAAGTFCEGNDSRLATPANHAARHLPGGVDTVFPGSFFADDVPHWNGTAFVPLQHSVRYSSGFGPSNSTTHVNIAGLSIAVNRIGVFMFEFYIMYNTNNVNEGVAAQAAFTGSSGPVRYGVEIYTSNNAREVHCDGAFAEGKGLTTVGPGNGGEPQIIRISGGFAAGSLGTLTAQLRCETGGANVFTTFPGSWAQLQQVS